jgi:hypothetical protein
MGFTIANLGMFSVSDKNGEDNFGGVFGADIFASLGSHKNMFNFDVGAGYSYIVTSDPDSKGYGEVPIYIRAIYNPMYKGYHNSDLDFYIGAEIRKYFSPKINFSTPVKVGFFYEGVMVDIYYEPCFTKMMNASYSGRFGVNFIYKFGF